LHPPGQPRNQGLLEFDIPFIRLNHAHDHVEGGSFTGAIRSQQPDNLTGSHGNRHAIDDPAVTVLFDQFVGREQRLRPFAIGR